MNQQRVKVNVADLIKRIEECKVADKAKHEKELKKFYQEEVKYLQKVEKLLEHTLEDVRDGNLPKDRYGDVRLNLPYPSPRRPEFRPGTYDQDINLLKMSAEPTITISSNSNFGKYL